MKKEKNKLTDEEIEVARAEAEYDRRRDMGYYDEPDIPE